MTLELTVVDSFTDRPFTGNPAAVAVVDGFPDDADMHAVAAEMNLAETAFVARRGDGDHDLRWFSPVGRNRPVRPCHIGRGPRARRVGLDSTPGVASSPAPAVRPALIEMDFPPTPSVAGDLAARSRPSTESAGSAMAVSTS